MNDLTVYLLQDFFENTLSLTGDVLDTFFDGTNTKITVCNIWNMRPQILVSPVQRIVLVDNVEHTILSINHIQNSFTILGDLTGSLTYLLPNPFYFFGTPRNANVEIANTSVQDKYPFVYLKEVIKEKMFNSLSGLDREASIRLFFLDEMDKENWHTKEMYSEVLIGLNKLVREVIKQLKTDLGNFYLVETEFDIINHADFGLLIQDQKGYIQSLFSDTLSGVELSFTLTIKKGCKPCKC